MSPETPVGDIGRREDRIAMAIAILQDLDVEDRQTVFAAFCETCREHLDDCPGHPE